MKYKVRITIVCTIVIAGIFFWQNNAQAPRSDNLATLKIGASLLTVELARTPDEHASGLMYRETLAEDSGMLFLFPASRKQIFWNKNTLMSLDVIWARNKKIIGISKLQTMANGFQTIASPEPVDSVLEVNLGWAERHGIKIGDALEW